MKTFFYSLILVTTFVLGNTASAKDDKPYFIVGAKVHFTHGQGPESELLSIMKQCGINGLYEDVYWEGVEQEKGKYLMPYEDIVNQSLKDGIEPAFVLGYWNKFYNGGGSPVTDESREGYAKYCEYVVKHFKGRMRHYEIWNEWGGYLGGFLPHVPRTGQSVENYVKLLKYVYPRIKAVDPNAIVQAGWMIEGYLDEMIERGALKYLDAVSIHAYPYNGGTHRYSPEGWIKWLMLADEKLAKASPNRKILFYVTETGWPTHILSDGTSPEKVLPYLARMFLLARSVPRLAGIYWYDFQNDRGFNPEDAESNFGLLDIDKMPKPAWFALRDVADLVATGKFIGQIKTKDPNAYVLKYKRKDGKDVLAIWSTTSDDFRRIVLKTTKKNPSPVEFQKVGHAPFIRNWGTRSHLENEPLVPNQLCVTAGETPWLIIGDLSDVTVLPDVKVRPMPESKRPTATRIHLPNDVVIATPVSAEPRVITFNPQDAVGIRELDTFSSVKGWSVYGQNAGPKTAINHVNKPAITMNGSAELIYDFKGATNQINMCGYAKPIRLPGNTSKICFRMCGDGSGNMVWVVLMDASGEKFSYNVIGIPGKDWEAVALDIYKRKPDAHWDGNNNEKFDWPLSFHSILLESNNRSKAAVGKAYIDELIVERKAKRDKSGPSFSVSWDADNLYLTVTVPDEKHVPQAEDAALWKGDSIQLALQALPKDGPMPRAFSEYTAALTANGPKLYCHSNQTGGTFGVIKDAKISIERKDNVTTYKLVLPAKMLGLPELKPSTMIPFSLVVNKNDGQERSYVEWGSGIASYKDPTMFNWIIISQ